MALDEIIFNALSADAELMQAVGNRIVSTCFEVGPDEQDKTPLPCIIVMDDGIQNQPDSKDCEWEAFEDRVQSSVEIDGRSPREVKQLLSQCRNAVAAYIRELAESGEVIPFLESIQTSGIDWDWLKPCYHTTITYNCTIDHEQE